MSFSIEATVVLPIICEVMRWVKVLVSSYWPTTVIKESITVLKAFITFADA
jgi:hypothetical protein